jgi:hypothetical protein
LVDERMTFDFCTGCGADYLVFPTKLIIAELAKEGCRHCNGREFKTMTAEEGCTWRRQKWPRRYHYWIQLENPMVEITSHPAEKTAVAHVTDGEDENSSFALTLDLQGKAAVHLEEQQKIWCREIEHLARRLAVALKMKPWEGEAAVASATPLPTVIKTSDYNTTRRWEYGAQIHWKDGLFDTEGRHIPGASVTRPPTAEDPFLLISIPVEVLGRLAS